jgi:pilus assembly protein CpaB
VLLRIVLGLLLVMGAAVLVGAGLGLMPKSPPPAPATAAAPPARVTVLVAAAPLRGGSLIRPQDLRGVEMARSEVPDGARADEPQRRGELTGAMVRRTLGEGQPILPGDIVRPGDHGFLAAVLRPGMRAVTVAVDAVSGTAGLIWPGDRVDVVMTQSLDDPQLASGHRVAAQTVLSDTRVIAIDQQLVQGAPPEGAAPPANRTATLEVTAAQVERVLVAAKLGHLSLSVLSADRAASAPDAVSRTVDASSRPVGSVTWGSDVSPALSNTDVHPPPVMMHVFQGNADSKDFRF